MKLFIVLNLDTFLLSHRKELAISALNNGYEVTVIAKDTGAAQSIQALGLNFIDLPINKTGLNIVEEFKTFTFLYSLFRRERPDIVHCVGMKTILWGGLAARLVRVNGFVSAVSGLGIMFSPEYNRGIKRLISSGVLLLMKYIHRSSDTYCIFHNTEDLELFVAKKIINRERCVRTMGSGIDLNVFAFKDEPSCDRLKVLFTARMIEEKGVLVLIDAANKLRSKYSGRVQFLLCGGLDTNPLAITKERLEQLCDGDYIQWLGRRNDVRELLEQCHIFAFPSYYKEGLPKSCIEASAIGRPIITCDSVGCRDTVVDGQTGYLVPKKDSDALAERLAKLLDDADLRRKMGRNARAYAEKMFSVEDVVKEHHRVYKDLI